MSSVLSYVIEFLLDEIEDTRLRLTHPVKRTWAVCRGGYVLTRDGEWEFNGMNSSRTEEFTKQTRYASVKEAAESYQNYLSKTTIIAVRNSPHCWNGYVPVDGGPLTADKLFNTFLECDRVILYAPGRVVQRVHYAACVADNDRDVPRIMPFES